MGLPTMWERPMTSARLPWGSTWASSSSRITPAGVQGRGAGLPSQSAPTFKRVEPVGVLGGGDGVEHLGLVDVLRQRQLHQDAVGLRVAG